MKTLAFALMTSTMAVCATWYEIAGYASQSENAGPVILFLAGLTIAWSVFEESK